VVARLAQPLQPHALGRGLAAGRAVPGVRVSIMLAGAASPEDLEGMLEDACLLKDASFLRNLFDVDALLLAQGTSQVRGRSAIANVIISQLRDGGSYVAAPQLVMQSGPLALIISANATSVARRCLDGWHYVISRLDL
jgi:hypothetical protein